MKSVSGYCVRQRRLLSNPVTYESVDQATLDTMKQLFGDISVKVAGGPKQEGVTDCGLFAIATCVSLVNGQQPDNYL